jgi:hypothetical protein
MKRGIGDLQIKSGELILVCISPNGPYNFSPTQIVALIKVHGFYLKRLRHLKGEVGLCSAISVMCLALQQD